MLEKFSPFLYSVNLLEDNVFISFLWSANKDFISLLVIPSIFKFLLPKPYFLYNFSLLDSTERLSVSNSLFILSYSFLNLELFFSMLPSIPTSFTNLEISK